MGHEPPVLGLLLLVLLLLLFGDRARPGGRRLRTTLWRRRTGRR
jgi:hypothetical protein